VLSELQSLSELGDQSSIHDEILSEIEESENENCVHRSGVPHIEITNQNDLIKQKLKWPTMSEEPVHEQTPGYMACAFPTLYPYGTADLRDHRGKEKKPGEYFKHLMNYHDKRFAKHPTFRFFAYNSWLRWTALADGNLFVKNNEEFANMTISELKEKIAENSNIMRQIMFHSSNLKGTKAYWHTRANELRDMVEQIGLPTIFLTLSCADGHWNDLYKLMTDTDVSLLTEKERRQLVQDNPHIVDSFFDQRVQSFIKNVGQSEKFIFECTYGCIVQYNNTENIFQVLKKKFKVFDYWYRIEYQHR